MASNIDTRNVSLGLGTLEVGEFVDGAFVAYRFVGAIKATLDLTWTRETHLFETGRPLLEVKREVLREFIEVAVTLAEVTVANIKMALGGGVSSTSIVPVFLDSPLDPPKGDLTDSKVGVVLADRFEFGGQCDVNNLALRFTHIKSCSTNTRQIFEAYKAVPTGVLALPFNETDWDLYRVTFRCLADTTRQAGKQMAQFLIERDP